MSNDIKRIAIVGCGAISVSHADALTQTDGVVISALCDILPERAQRLKELFELDCEIYSDFNKLIEDTELYALHICTPHYLHAPMTVAALEKGINVFLEKPMCISEEEIELILDAEKKSSAKVCVCFQNRFLPCFIRLKELAATHGGIESARGMVSWCRGKAYYASGDWRGKIATEGGGVMINQAIHTLDLLISCCVEPEYVIAQASNHLLKDVIEVEDTCETVIGFKGGKRGVFYATNCFSKDAPVFLEAFCSDGASLMMMGDKLYENGEKIAVESISDRPVGKACWGSCHKDIIALYYSALESGKEMPVTAKSASNAVRVLLASYKSNDKIIKLTEED